MKPLKPESVIMSKIRISILLLTNAIFLPTLCMLNTRPQLKPWKHQPLIEQSTPFTISHRKQIEQHLDLAPQLNPNIGIVRGATPDELENKCDYYALKKATGFTNPGHFYDRVEIIADCFSQTKKPTPNDIAVYTEDVSSLSPLHFAVVKSVKFPKKKSFLTKEKPAPIIVLESKWGSHTYILEHGPFDVPTCYGTACGFFTLNDEYKNKRA
jgi:hypothetical protein